MIEALDEATNMGFTGIGVNAEDPSRSDMDYLIKFASAAQNMGRSGSDIVKCIRGVKAQNPFMIEYQFWQRD